MLVDSVMVFNELDLLKVRLSEHYDQVDKIYIIEAERTHSNKPKEMYFADSKSEFVEWQDKIEHLIVPASEFIECDAPLPQKTAWHNEEVQRFWIWTKGYLNNFGTNDWLLVADCDEIIKKENFRMLLYWLNNKCTTDIARIDLDFFYTSVNLFYPKVWDPKRLFRISNLSLSKTNYRPAKRLYDMASDTCPNKIGWHFSYLGSPKKIKQKMDAISDFRIIEKFSREDTIASAIRKQKDLLGHNDRKLIQLPGKSHLPRYMLDNWKDYMEYFKCTG